MSNSHKSTQKGLAPSYGLRCAQVPSRRLCSVGTPPRAIHGPVAALPASMPVDPLLSTSSRPPGRAGRSKALHPEAADRPACFEAGSATGIFPLWEPGLPAMQAPRSIWRNKVLASRAGPLPQELVLVKFFAFAFAFAFVVATRLCRRRECPSQKAERRCCYGGGAAGRRASRDGPWMARRGVPP